MASLNEAMVSMGLIDHPIRMIYNTTGVVIGMSHIMLPIMVLALYSVMRGIDLDLMKVSESSARTGSSPFCASTSRSASRASGPACCWSSSSPSAST